MSKKIEVKRALFLCLKKKKNLQIFILKKDKLSFLKNYQTSNANGLSSKRMDKQL